MKTAAAIVRRKILVLSLWQADPVVFEDVEDEGVSFFLLSPSPKPRPSAIAMVANNRATALPRTIHNFRLADPGRGGSVVVGCDCVWLAVAGRDVGCELGGWLKLALMAMCDLTSGRAS